MRTRVKVCCIMSEAEVAMAVAAGADALGLVGAMPSGPGILPIDRIAALAALAPPPVMPFLLTAKTRASAIAAAADAAGAPCVQLVASVVPAELEALAALRPGLKRVQVIHVEDTRALDAIGPLTPYIDAFLLDSGRPSAPVPELGGTGRTHDWGISAAFVRASPRPVFLAGGLTPANVADAIRTARPFGVDLCTGVRRDGALHADTLAAFMAAVRAC